MTVLQTVNEGSTSKLTVDFLDYDGVAEMPTDVTYRIDCLTTGTAIKGETAVLPAAQVEIIVVASENDIQDQSNARERRLVTVTAIYGADDEVNEEYVYIVKNLRQVT